MNYAGEPDCNLPHRKSDGGLYNYLPIDILDWPDIERTALLEFYSDYCIVSPNQVLSRGYLHGLQAMIAKAGPTSEVAKACTVIALANLGKMVKIPHLQKRLRTYTPHRYDLFA